MKTCKSCKQNLPLHAFSKMAKARDGLQGKCKPCFSEYNKSIYAEKKDEIKSRNATWQRENKEKRKACQSRHREKLGRSKIREKEVLRIYGLTSDALDGMKASQGGVCAICKKTTNWERKKGELVIDHDHKSGKVRGLLCHPCNTAIGMMADSPARLRAAAEYVERAGDF